MSGEFRTGFQATARAGDAYYLAENRPQVAQEKPFNDVFERAFEAEIGVTPSRLLAAIKRLQDLALTKGAICFELTREELESKLICRGQIEAEHCQMLLHNLTLSLRPEWAKPPNGFHSRDIEPWSFGRKLSLVSRPFIRLSESPSGPYFVHPAMIEDFVIHTLEQFLNAHIRTDRFHSVAMKNWVDSELNRLGALFNLIVAERFRAMGLQATDSVKMSAFGVTKGKDLGDVDVLAWTATGNVFAVECKRLKPARNVSEIVNRLRGFRGELGDRLHKHLERTRWL
jgi:hypothetical protein